MLRGQTAFSLVLHRYYRGRHFLQERSRSAKRIHLSELKRPHSSRTIRQHGRPSTLLLPPAAPLVPPPSKAAAAVQQQEQLAGSSGRRLVIPAPAFIPLEAPEELLQQAGVSGAGGWQQQGGQAGASSKRQQVVLAPAELVEQVRGGWNVHVRLVARLEPIPFCMNGPGAVPRIPACNCQPQRIHHL